MATDNEHKVYRNKSGKKVMRITEVIKILAKDQLIVWANMLGFKKISYRKELERTSNIGTMVHGVIEDFSDDSTVTDLTQYYKYHVYTYSDQVEARHALDSFFKWYDKHKDLYKVKATEYKMVSDTVGGTADVLLTSPFHKDRVIIGDYKTGKSVYLSMILQTAGYCYLYEELHGKNTCDGVVIFQLDKKEGRPAHTVYINRKKLQPYIDGFLSLMNTAIAIKNLEEQFPKDKTTLE